MCGRRSDANKILLLANHDFIPYLIGGLLLDPHHPRADMADDVKVWLQNTHAECFAQLAVFGPGREALRQDSDVAEALHEVADKGLSEQSRELASQALMAMSDTELHVITEGQMHVMLSYQWAHQPIIIRVHESLLRRGYVMWFDRACCYPLVC